MKYVNYHRVQERFAEMGFTVPFHYGDTEMMTLRLRWVQTVFADYFEAVLKARKIKKYLPVAWDCENFCLAAMNEINICHYASEAETSAAGLDFGMIWIPGHSINWGVFSDTPNDWEIKFVDPQLRFKERKLTQDEIARTQHILQC